MTCPEKVGVFSFCHFSFFDGFAELLVVPADILDPIAAPGRNRSVTTDEVSTKPSSKTAHADMRKESVSERKKFSFSFSKKTRSASVSERQTPSIVTGLGL